MLFFGHIGITAGAVKAGELFLAWPKPDSKRQPKPNSKSDANIGNGRSRLSNLLNWLRSHLGSVDYRLVLVGSLLPDLIDKPVWFLVNGDVSLSGRDYGHTLLFGLILLLGSLVLITYGKLWLLIISLSSFIHLVLDRMWESPVVLLWPLLGPLPKEGTVGWASSILEALLSSPETYIPEIIGLVILAVFAYRLVKKRRFTSFMKSGVVS